jgi:hypothetical protein
MPIITLTPAEARDALDEIEVSIDCLKKYAKEKLKPHAKVFANQRLMRLENVRATLASAIELHNGCFNASPEAPKVIGIFRDELLRK